MISCDSCLTFDSRNFKTSKKESIIRFLSSHAIALPAKYNNAKLCLFVIQSECSEISRLRASHSYLKSLLESYYSKSENSQKLDQHEHKILDTLLLLFHVHSVPLLNENSDVMNTFLHVLLSIDPSNTREVKIDRSEKRS